MFNIIFINISMLFGKFANWILSINSQIIRIKNIIKTVRDNEWFSYFILIISFIFKLHLFLIKSNI